jgi:molybdopterin converting factor small subunit
MRLYLGGYLDYYNPQPGSWLEVELEGPSPLREVLVKLDIPTSEIHLCAINGELTELSEAVVSGGDEVKLFPPVGGG